VLGVLALLHQVQVNHFMQQHTAVS
jgi:hypothetical protein